MTNRTFIFPLLALAFVLPFATHAKDIEYFSIEDASMSEVLLLEKGLEQKSWYRCPLGTLSCAATASSTTLLPTALTNAIHYYISPRNDWAVTTTFVPGSTPKHVVYSIVGNTLTQKAVLPITMDLTRVRFSDNGNVLILTQADGVVMRYDVAAKKLSAVTAFPASSSWTNVSPDGRYVAYYIPATLSRGQRTFGVVDTVADKGYTFDEPTTYWDLLTEGTTLFAFSPDSTKLLYLSDREGYATPFQVSLSELSTKGLAGTRLISKDYTVNDFVWSDNGTILFSANRDNVLTYSLYSYTPASGVVTKVIDNVSYDAAMIKVGDKVLFSRIQGSARIPAVYSASSKSVSAFSIPGFAPTATEAGEIVQAGSLSGVWMKPPAATKKLIVWLHGGPYRQVSPVYHSYFGYAGYDWMLEQVQDTNVAVLKLDYPGSQGHGRAFAESITREVGGDDVTKTRAAVQAFAKKNGYTEVYLVGNSYGGYLALKMLADHPKDFAGAFSINGVTDWDVLTANLRTSIFNVQFGGVKNAQNTNLYEQADILGKIGDLKKQKVVLTHGNADMTVPYAQSRLLSEALENEDKNVKFITYEGEDHVYSKESTFLDLCKNVLEFAGVKGKCSI